MFLSLIAATATASDVTDWAVKLNRSDMVAITCERRDDVFILSHANEIARLINGETFTHASLRQYMGRLLYRKGNITYADAARVLRAVVEAEASYDPSVTSNCVAAFVTIFPLATSDQEIRAIAEETGWRIDDHSWKLGLWIGDVQRTADGGNRRSLPWWGPVRQPVKPVQP